MVRIFLISDTHFGHANIIRYSNRPFADVKEMDDALVDNWNRVVRPQDHVYHLGDVAMRRPDLAIVKKLNGHKRLIFGNHDIYDYKSYTEVGFRKLMGLRVLADCVLTHIPIHPASVKERWLGNIHGHTHERGSPEGRYLSVAVEQINYTPVLLDECVARLRSLT